MSLHETSQVITYARQQTHIIFCCWCVKNLRFFSVWSQVWMKKHTDTHTSVASIHLTDFKKPSATSKNQNTPAHPPRCCGEALGGTAHWGEANSLLRVPATFLQLHCHIASLLTHHYPSSCYFTAREHQLLRK